MVARRGAWRPFLTMLHIGTEPGFELWGSTRHGGWEWRHPWSQIDKGESCRSAQMLDVILIILIDRPFPLPDGNALFAGTGFQLSPATGVAAKDPDIMAGLHIPP